VIKTITIIQHIARDAVIPALTQGNSRWFCVDVIEAIKLNDMMGILCLIITTIYSVISWGVIGYKYLHIRQATNQSNKFIEQCMAGKGNLERAFQIASNFPDSPLAQILRESYLELEMENWYQGDKDMTLDGRLNAAKISLERVMEQTSANEIRHLENGLNFLATTANVCPLIGLFGTVWGILGAFQVVAKEGSASVGSLGPGVSTALMTTVAGLIAAIPAVIAYNYFVTKVQILVRRMDAFGMEASNIIQKQIMKKGIKGK